MDLWASLKSIFSKNNNKTDEEYYEEWTKKKERSIYKRTYLSSYLAGSLLILSFFREAADIIFHDYLNHSSFWVHVVWLLCLFVLMIWVGFAYYWEKHGEKLEVSPQERRFALGIEAMLSDTEKIKRELNDIRERADINEDKEEFMVSQSQQVEAVLNKYIDRFIWMGSEILCEDKKVHAGVMFHDRKDNSLTLFNATKNSGYFNLRYELTIDLNEIETNPGPAQMSFDRTLLGHMPQKSKKLGWLYVRPADNPDRMIEILAKESPTMKEILEADKNRWRYDDDFYRSEFIRGWTEPPKSDDDVFESVISVPIISFAEEEKIAKHGVLSFTTDKDDHFIKRDYVMAFCFASIIAQSKDLASLKIRRIGEKNIY